MPTTPLPLRRSTSPPRIIRNIHRNNSPFIATPTEYRYESRPTLIRDLNYELNKMIIEPPSAPIARIDSIQALKRIFKILKTPINSDIHPIARRIKRIILRNNQNDPVISRTLQKLNRKLRRRQILSLQERLQCNDLVRLHLLEFICRRHIELPTLTIFIITNQVSQSRAQ